MHVFNSQSDNYWSSTSYQNPGNENNAWIVNFNDGNMNNNDKTNENFVRCVREFLYRALYFMYTKEETIFTLKNIWKAYETCIRRKKKSVNRFKFELKKEREIINLREELLSRKYKISRHIYFVVTEPKPREVFAGDFRDRVVHHLIYNELSPLCESWFIENSFANRTGKGTHAGFRKVKEYVKQNPKAWYLKLDIFSFFRSIDKQILFSIVSDFINMQDEPIWWKRDLLWLCEEIIYHDPTLNYTFKGELKTKSLIPIQKSLFYANGNGLPIGNLTSQFFANCYLDGLDKYITETLGNSHYVRYVDDFVILDEDKEKLQEAVNEVDRFLCENLSLCLCKDKTILQPTERGIDFLGYFIKPTHTLVRQKVVKRFKDRLYKRRNPIDGFFSLSDIPMIQSYFGHFSHAYSYDLVRELGRY